MRLSHHLSQEERFKRVEQVITEVDTHCMHKLYSNLFTHLQTGLISVADTVVGGNIGQGLSGGQVHQTGFHDIVNW